MKPTKAGDLTEDKKIVVCWRISAYRFKKNDSDKVTAVTHSTHSDEKSLYNARFTLSQWTKDGWENPRIKRIVRKRTAEELRAALYERIRAAKFILLDGYSKEQILNIIQNT